MRARKLVSTNVCGLEKYVKSRPDKTIECKNAIRNTFGVRECTEKRGHPAPRMCLACDYREPRREGKGVCDWVELVIDKVSGGKAKPAAEAIAKKAGKSGCGCAKRKAALNRIGGKK